MWTVPGVRAQARVYPGESGETRRGPLTGFPWVSSRWLDLSHLVPTAILGGRQALETSLYREQAQREPLMANRVWALLRESPTGSCRLPAVGLGLRLGLGLGERLKNLAMPLIPQFIESLHAHIL